MIATITRAWPDSQARQTIQFIIEMPGIEPGEVLRQRRIALKREANPALYDFIAARVTGAGN